MEKVGNFASYGQFREEMDELDEKLSAGSRGDREKADSKEQSRYELLALAEAFIADRNDKEQLLPLFADFDQENLSVLEEAIGYIDEVEAKAKLWSNLDAKKLLVLLVLLRVPRDRLRSALEHPDAKHLMAT